MELLIGTIIGTGIAVAIVLILFILTLKEDMNAYKREIRGWKEEIYKEMKDFHGRLCSLEGRTKTDL